MKYLILVLMLSSCATIQLDSKGFKGPGKYISNRCFENSVYNPNIGDDDLDCGNLLTDEEAGYNQAAYDECMDSADETECDGIGESTDIEDKCISEFFDRVDYPYEKFGVSYFNFSVNKCIFEEKNK